MIRRIACTFAVLFAVLAFPTRSVQNDGKLVYVTKLVDEKQGIIYLQPTLPAWIGAVYSEGNQVIQKGDVLNCKPTNQMKKIIIDGVEATLTTMVLDCGDRKLRVIGMYFNAPE